MLGGIEGVRGEARAGERDSVDASNDWDGSGKRDAARIEVVNNVG
jgi:hypothetical protein